MTPKFRAIINDSAEYEVYKRDVGNFKAWLESFRPGTHVFITIKRITKRKIRSLEQNAYYHGVVIKILSDHTGYLPEEMHEALKQKFLSYENVPGLPTALSTTRLSTVEMEVYLQKIRRWAATDLGVFIPKPNEVST